MATPRDRLLERYREAAASVGSRCTRNEDAGAEIPDDTPRIQPSNPCIRPMEEILARQASQLQRMHDATLEQQDDSRGHDDELLLKRLEDLASISMSRFYSHRYDRVPDQWRHLYTDTLVLTSYFFLLRSLSSDDASSDGTWRLVVENLDRALITTGGASRNLGPRWIEATMDMLDLYFRDHAENERPVKRQKIIESPTFSTEEPYGRPQLSRTAECARHQGWSLDRFESYLNNNGNPEPVVFTDLIGNWPALTDRPWKSIDYILSHTLGGRRLVPVEIGRSYVDEGWGQELISFKAFLDKYVLPDASLQGAVGYLAQHNLFRQIPSLRNDIQIPDFCWADAPGHPTDPSKDQAKLDMPQLNAWFGPARTITPLHTDGYHNLLCQAVGYKYVRLYPPSATPWMRPRAPEHGVDMSNTSAVDVGVVEGWDAVTEDVDEAMLGEMREQLKQVGYRECILGPGDTLLIPIGWWHYVRSLSVSFSVSFWWN